MNIPILKEAEAEKKQIVSVEKQEAPFNYSQEKKQI